MRIGTPMRVELAAEHLGLAARPARRRPRAGQRVEAVVGLRRGPGSGDGSSSPGSQRAEQVEPGRAPGDVRFGGSG